MEALLREPGVEMQTFSVNGVRVRLRTDEAIVHAVWNAYLQRTAAFDASR